MANQDTQSGYIHKNARFSHQDAERIYRNALRYNTATTIVIDLANATEATTCAFARLVLLRRALLECGRDLRLIGLRGRAALLFEVNRLREVLPCDLFELESPRLAV